ncbi:aminotransferase class V-fold PLP-dependent enzyme [Robbsia andropogonis]|uniref:aminotransferase class V-fold PLP-dependent enzyme n=1 Tax=Robbsia andropogonis TaxID=28092 RepID=UPI0004AF9AA1|nr:aminotransferase class V-fold PLP-dependent enzyme [Robbsia andropogonis]MCP1116883.1 aminotransferase class V-fold PLP-dependent enzyme [Robbsia andropogonis]MCP1126438.1 aminotransferase class V-fold PLP-dependent enzyme [Robbsia andropogonis]
MMIAPPPAPTPPSCNLPDSGIENRDSGWCLYHSAGRFPGQQQAIDRALKAFTQAWCAPQEEGWQFALEARSQLLRNWATLINAPVDSLFPAPNVTEALARCIDTLADNTHGPSLLRNRVVLIAADCFPSLHFLLRGLSDRHGFTLRTVAATQSAPGGPTYVSDDDYLAAWDDDVALAVVTWVSSLTSKRVDLARLCAHAQKRGTVVAVDITQGAGILPFDLQAYPVDIVCGSTLKWLCGVPGAAFAYAGPRLFASGRVPGLRGWFSQPDPFNWDLSRFTFAPDARRFDTGTPSVLPYIASRPGFDWVLSQGVDVLRRHNLALGDAILDIADTCDLPVLTPRDPAGRGGSIMLALPTPAQAAAAVQTLASHQVAADARGCTLRLSPGARTTPAGIDRLAAALHQAKRGG